MSQPVLAATRHNRSGVATTHLQAGQSLLAAEGLVRDHATDGVVQDAAGSAEVEGATLGVGVVVLAQLLEELELVAEV